MSILFRIKQAVQELLNLLGINDAGDNLEVNDEGDLLEL
jgi:hypothetical protein